MAQVQQQPFETNTTEMYPTATFVVAQDRSRDRPRRSNWEMLKRTTAASLALTVSGVAVYTGVKIAETIGNIFDGGLGEINLAADVDLGGLDGDPVQIEEAVDHTSYELEGKFNMDVRSRIGVKVNVTGEKGGALWGLGGVTDSHFSKRYYIDFLLGGDQALLNDSLVTVNEPPEKEGEQPKVVGVKASLNALEIFQPRIDFGDPRNLLDINADDGAEEEQRKIEESDIDTTAGYNCGYHFGGLGMCDGDDVGMVDMAKMLAQYGIMVDGIPPVVIQELTEGYVEDVRRELAGYFKIDISEVEIGVVYGPGMDPANPPTSEEIAAIYKERMMQVYEESLAEYEKQGLTLFEKLPEYVEHEDKARHVHMYPKGGGELILDLNSMELDAETERTVIANINMQERSLEEQERQKTQEQVVVSVVEGEPQEPQVTSTSTAPLGPYCGESPCPSNNPLDDVFRRTYDDELEEESND